MNEKQPVWPKRWAGKTWLTDEGGVTDADLRKLYEAIGTGLHSAVPRAIGENSYASRRVDRALQKLREAGLVSYDRSLRKWSQCPGAPAVPRG